MTTGPRAQPSLTPMHSGRLPARSCRHARVDGLHRQSGRTASRNTPSTIMSPIRSHPGSWTEIRLGVRAHPTRTANQPHAPPGPERATDSRPDSALTPRTCTDKERAFGEEELSRHALMLVVSRERLRSTLVVLRRKDILARLENAIDSCNQAAGVLKPSE
jgi:hypothetical protein